MKSYLIATLLALSTVTAYAQDQFGRNAPVQQLVRATEDGQLELLVLACRCMPVTKTESYTVKVPVEVNGKKEFKTEEKLRTICEMVTESEVYAAPLDVNQLKVFETDGRPVDVKTLVRRIKKPTLVVMANDGKMVAPYYAGVFKPGTLIIAPQAGGGDGPPPLSAANEARISPIRVVSQVEAKPEARPPVPGEVPAAVNLKLGIDLPKSLPPTMLYARVPEAGKINLRHYSESVGEREFATEIKKQGVPETVLMKQLQKFTRSEAIQLDLSEVQATTADAKPLNAQALTEKLKKATVVLASSMGQKVDPFWLQNVKPDVVVLIPPAGLGFGGAACYPMPVSPPAGPGQAPPPPPGGPAPVPAPAPVSKEATEGNT